MTPLKFSRLIVLFCPIFLFGCSGYDRALLATKTNVGLDIDTEPPTAELTIARREIGIQPTFPDYADKESALPLFASFGLGGNFLNPAITGHFAGGAAAVLLTSKAENTNAKGDQSKSALHTICLDKKPEDTRGLLMKFWYWITFRTKEEYRNEPRPFFFATDTAYGLKVAWSGTTGPYPDSLKLGYNRKEFASAPIFVEDGCRGEKNTETNKKWEVKLPSFYASIDNASAVESLPWETATKHVQIFATGQAANNFVQRASVKRIAFEHMNPAAAAWEIKQTGIGQPWVQEIKNKWDGLAKEEHKEALIQDLLAAKLVGVETTNENFIKNLSSLFTSISGLTTLQDIKNHVTNYQPPPTS